MNQDGGGSGGNSRRDSGGFFSWNRSRGLQQQQQQQQQQHQHEQQQQQQHQKQEQHRPIQQMTMLHQQTHRNHPQSSHTAEQQHEEDQHVSPTPFRPMQPREFSLGGNLQRYRTLSTIDGRPLLLPLTLPADVGSGSIAGSVSGGSIGAISTRHSRMESAGTANDSVGSGNAEKAHPHHVVDPYSGGRTHTIAGTSENPIQVEGEVGAPLPALTKRSSVNSRRNSFESSMRRIIEEEHSATSISTSLESSHDNMHHDNVDVSGEEDEEELVYHSMLGVQRLQKLEQQQWEQPVGIVALSATSIASAADSNRSQAPFSPESLDMDSSNLSPPPLSPDEVIADVGKSSNFLLVYEDKEEEEEVAENCGNEVAVGSVNIREWPAGSSSVSSQSQLSKKRPAELSTAMREDFISPRRKDITTTTPMTVSTMSPTDASPSAAAAADTATARFGRLLQECRDLTETCEEDSAETPSSTNKTSSSSGGIRSLLQIKANAAAAAASAATEADASKPPVALLQREIDTSKDGTMKLMQVSNLTMDPALLYSMRSSQYTTDSYRDSYHGSMNFRSTEYGKQHSDFGSSTNAPHFEASKVPLKEENSDREEPSGMRSPTQKRAISKSVISDLSLGVDLMYGDLADEDRSGERWQGDDETASFNPSEYLITDLGKSARLSILVQKQRILPEVENDKKKVVTEATHHPELLNEMDETNIHGRTFRPKEEETSMRYSWLSYTTNGDNDDTSGKKSTPEKSIERLADPGTKTSPLEDDELIIPKSSIETASNHSTESSEGGDGLLVGFGHRAKAGHNEDSSVSSSDSSDSSSSGSGGSSSYGSGSCESGSSGSGSSGSGSSSGESSTSSEENLSLPALARHGLHIPTTRRDSDLVSELSFGGASALMAVQPLRSPIPKAGNSQDREKNEVSVSTPSPVTMPGAFNESSPEDLNQRITAGDANEPQSSIEFRPTLLSPEQTRRAPHRDYSSRASSRSRDPKRASNMLEKLEELSESCASFLDDVSSIAEPNKAVLAFLSEPATSEWSSSSTSQKGHEFEKGKGIVAKTSLTLGELGDQKLSVLAGNDYRHAQRKLDEVSESNASFLDDVSSINEPNNIVQKFLAPSDSDSLASSRTPQKSQDEVKASSSITSESSKKEPSSVKYVPLSFPRPHSNTSQDESIKSSKKKRRSNSKSSSTLSNRKTNNNPSLSSGNYYSEIVARATAMKSSSAVNDPLSSESSISASTVSSHRQMQQSLGLGGGGQDAGTKTTESFRSIRKEGANSDALIAQTSTAVFASENITNVESQQQNMEQGSGESPLEHINHDDVSSMSSVVSRAKKMSRDVRGVDSMSASSRSNRLSARNSREGNVGKMMQPWLSSESLDLCDIAGKASKLEKSGSRAESASSEFDVNGAKQSSLKGHLTFSRLSVKSGDDISFAKEGLYEDFPSKTSDNDDVFFRQPSSSLQLLPTNVETDSKKPWKTAPRATSVDRSSHCDSQGSSRKLKHEYDVEFQQPFVERRSDGENRSDGSMELFESNLALKRMGLYDETSILDASENKLPTMDETLISEFIKDESCHLTIDEQPELENTDERDDQNEKASRSSCKYFAAAAQEMTDILRSSIISKQLSISDASSSHYQSERSGMGIIDEMKSFQKSFAMKMRSDSPSVGGEEDVIVDEDHSKKAASEVESSVDSEHHEWNDDLSEVKSAVGDISYIKSLDEESKESEHDINTMLHSFRKRGSAASGNPFDDSIASHTFQDDELVDKISVSSSASPYSIEHANDENNARDDNLNGTTQKSLCCQRGGDCQKSKLCWIVVVVIVLVVVITISIVVGQLMKKPPEPELTPPSETKTSSPTPFPTPRPPNWIQVGGDLVGESSVDEAGHSVSVSEDGNRVIVGARRNNKDDMKNRGAARIFQLDEGTGSYVPIWDIYGEAAGDQCGFSVSMSRSGRRIAVGSIGSDKNGKNSGQVRIYEEEAKTWSLVHEMLGEQEAALFGTSVSLSQDGSSIAVGAPYHSEGADMTKSGRSYVYREVQESEWEQIGQPIYGASSDDLFGWSVSFSPNAQFVAVGSPMLEGSLESGYVKVFSLEGSTWLEHGEPMSMGVPGDRFGFSVSLAGDDTLQRVSIGAPGMSENGEGSGLVAVYENDGNGWQRFGDDLLGGSSGDNFGHSVTMTPDAARFLVGVPNKKFEGVRVGQVRVFDVFSDSIESAGDIYGLVGENFGISVSLSYRGMFAFVGASNHNSVRVYADAN